MKPSDLVEQERKERIVLRLTELIGGNVEHSEDFGSNLELDGTIGFPNGYGNLEDLRKGFFDRWVIPPIKSGCLRRGDKCVNPAVGDLLPLRVSLIFNIAHAMDRILQMWNRRQMRALTSRLILTAVLSSVLGCSTTFSLGYEMGPFLVSRELEKRLPLSDAAESKLDQDLEVYFQWHRGKMLGEYVTTLEAWRKEARGGRSTELWLWPDIGRLIADTLLPLGEIV